MKLSKTTRNPSQKCTKRNLHLHLKLTVEFLYSRGGFVNFGIVKKRGVAERERYLLPSFYY